MKTLQKLVSSLEHKDGVAVSWNERVNLKDENGKDILKDELHQLTFNELYHTINAYSRGLIELGLQKGDSIAIISGNNPQWMQLSLGANNTGMIDIPKDEKSKTEDLEYILTHSKPKLVIIENEKVLQNIDLTGYPEIKHVYSIENTKNIRNITEIKELGERSDAKIFDVSPDDVAGRIYTSGTTGRPKGVELTQNNLLSNVVALQEMLHLDHTDKGISNLPAWHVFERSHKNLLLYTGVEAFYTNISSIAKDFREQQPTMVVVVPRMLEVIYTKTMDTIKEKGKVIKWMFDRLYPLTLDYHKRDGGIKKFFEKISYGIADKLFFSKIRNNLGGKIRYLVTGSSSLPKYLEDFFVASGFDVLEGYGMTEASPVISARRPGKKMYYSVGRLLNNTEGKIVDPETEEELPRGKEGVLWVKGPGIMKGYYNDEEETKKVLIKNGWFNTGDRFYFNKDGTLTFTGRQKEQIKLSNGEYINPSPLEDALSKSPYIAAAMVLGRDSWRNLGVLIHPKYEKIKEYYDSNGMKFDEKDPINNLVNHSTGKKVPEIEKIYYKEIKNIINNNDRFGPHEHIIYFEYIKELRLGEELTATYKIIKRKVLEVYHEEVERMHEFMQQKIRDYKTRRHK